MSRPRNAAKKLSDIRAGSTPGKVVGGKARP
jgi:hypothetical protein